MATRILASEGANTPANNVTSDDGLSRGHLAAERELKISIRPFKLDFWEYEGPRAQLEAENVIPPDARWPEHAERLRFDVGNFRYELRRCRGPGVKGPMKSWRCGDWWCLRCELINGPSLADRTILDKQRELDKALYARSPAGQREWQSQYQKYWKARDDSAFQDFKAKVLPERTRPSRKPKVQGGEA